MSNYQKMWHHGLDFIGHDAFLSAPGDDYMDIFFMENHLDGMKYF
jgi:hypothetical protein